MEKLNCIYMKKIKKSGKLNVKSMLKRIWCLTKGIKTNTYTGRSSLTLSYEKDSWNREIIENVSSFFTSVFTVEEYHEIANLKFPIMGQTPEELFKLKCQHNTLEVYRQKD